jgi:hypothetical protein
VVLYHDEHRDVTHRTEIDKRDGRRAKGHFSSFKFFAPTKPTAMSALFRSNGSTNKRSRLSSASSALSHPSAALSCPLLASPASSSRYSQVEIALEQIQRKHRQLKIIYTDLVSTKVCFFMTSLLMSISVYPHNLLLCECYIRLPMRR